MVEYLLAETEQSQKLARQKFLYLEDRRRYEFNGTSKSRGTSSSPLLHLLILTTHFNDSSPATGTGGVQAVQSCSQTFGETNGPAHPRSVCDSRGEQKVSSSLPPPYMSDTDAVDLRLYRKTRMLSKEALTDGQRNSLATGNSLMDTKGKKAMVRVVVVLPGTKAHSEPLYQRIHHSTVKHTDPRSQKERTFRMAKQNLIDTLFDEFGRYKYWSIRALRERLMQPEAWLKECLLEVAEQEQDGPYKSESKHCCH